MGSLQLRRSWSIGVLLIGVASGTFLAVDWALMTDIIPKASSGRFMGISNLAVGLAGPVAALLAGPIIDIVGGKAETGDGPRAAFVAGFVAVRAGGRVPAARRPDTPRAAPGSGRPDTPGGTRPGHVRRLTGTSGSAHEPNGVR